MDVKPADSRPRPIPTLAWGVPALCLLVLIVPAWHWMSESPPVRAALFAGAAAALATTFGALPALAVSALSQRVNDSLLGFGAGVMLAATCFSLLLPALEVAHEQGHGRWAAPLVVSVGVLIGVIFLMVMERLVPNEHAVLPRVSDPKEARRVRRLWLFVFAIALHNVPEGLAIGVAAAGTEAGRAAALTLGISIQNVPEGLIVALALMSVGVRRLWAFLVSAGCGLLEPVAAVLGAATLVVSLPLLPWGLAFAGGAMLFVVSHEIIPESPRQGHERCATVGLVLGFVLMMTLDVALTG